MQINYFPPFTQYIVSQNLLKNDPFFLVDVGASGGVSNYWDVFQGSLIGVGFDPLVSECSTLNELSASRPGKIIYDAYYIGSDDTEVQEIAKQNHAYVSKAFNGLSSTWAQEQEKVSYIQKHFNHSQQLVYTDRKISLDRYFDENYVDTIDFIKIDTDGFDYETLHGAQKILIEKNVLGVLIECEFHGMQHPHSNVFHNIDRLLTALGFYLYSIDANEYTRRALPGKFLYNIPAQTQSGQVMWGDALYLRYPVIKPARDALNWPISKLLKLACIQEIFGKSDCAIELLTLCEQDLQRVIDVRQCLDILTRNIGMADTYEEHLKKFTQSVSSFYPASSDLETKNPTFKSSSKRLIKKILDRIIA
jgi:FkbM family methyltransferase